MKINKEIWWLSCLRILLFFFFFHCDSDNALTYGNRMMDAINRSTEDMEPMNDALSKEDYVLAERIRKSWEKKLKTAIEEVESIGDFKEDPSYKNACLSAMEIYENSIGTDYKRLVELRKNEKNGIEIDRTELRTLSRRIDRDLKKAAQELNAASEKFERKNFVR
ncbi:hypothetical protein CH379_016000 [Leptospira ellisii]|uniref:Uncharacterized protein n=1 Tax=Leptospira ellisii TaxID=2023197 RepID=A0A2N0B344_9LEPT|nr:hypothetical protein [Leptospira ellisii]MDV6237135.1 hypothetical protein [Leptospira ellisii]PJZ90943.1 hypothetical protein CH379_21450 [Leptospira ellisii]PKA02898.1 hypothetical protein CH375_20220 [Leptospira ellisii]